MPKKHLILISFLLVSGTCYGQDDSLVFSADSALVADSAKSAMDTTAWADLLSWREWQQKSQELQRQGRTEEALAAAESSLVRSRALGLDLPAIGAYWGSKARQALRERDWQGAKKYSLLSSLADDHSFKNEITRFQANRRTAGMVTALGEFIQTVKGYRQDFRFGYRAFGLGAFWLSLALMAGMLLFLLLLTVKYLPYLFHLISDLLPRRWPYFGRIFLTASLGSGLLLLLAGFSLPLAVMIPAGLAVVMGNTRERIMFWVALLLVGCSAVGFNMVHQLFTAGDRGRVETLAVANTSDWENPLVQALAEQQQQDPSDLKPIYALALMEKNRGRLDRAGTYLSAILEASGNNPTALNNMGNLYFLKGQFDSAGSFYRRAIETDGRLAEAHYNLAQVYLKAIDFNQARAELEKAASLAPARIEKRNRASGGNMVMDAHLAPDMLWSEVWRGWSPMGTFTPGEFMNLSRLSLWLPIWAWLGALIFSLVWMVLIKDNLEVHGCWLCGRHVCDRCQTLAQDGNRYCHQCHQQVFSIQSAELQQKTAEALSGRAVKREWIISGLANLWLPGSSFMMRGDTMKSWLLSLSIGSAFAGLVFLISPWIAFRLDYAVKNEFYLMAGAVMAVLYLISWIGYIQLFKKQGAADAA